MNTFLFFAPYVVFVCKVIGILAVTLLAVLAVDLAYYYHQGSQEAKQKATDTKSHISDMLLKEKNRRQKEVDAAEGYFEESYAWVLNADNVWVFEAYKIPTMRGMHYMREMDRLHDAVIFHNTEEL